MLIDSVARPPVAMSWHALEPALMPPPPASARKRFSSRATQIDIECVRHLRLVSPDRAAARQRSGRAMGLCLRAWRRPWRLNPPRLRDREHHPTPRTRWPHQSRPSGPGARRSARSRDRTLAARPGCSRESTATTPGASRCPRSAGSSTGARVQRRHSSRGVGLLVVGDVPVHCVRRADVRMAPARLCLPGTRSPGASRPADPGSGDRARSCERPSRPRLVLPGDCGTSAGIGWRR